MKYTAFGEIRDINGSSPTDYLYTGQRKEVEFGLSYYVARWYDPSTAHFVQADTVIPAPGVSGAWDRYAYVLNNPLKYIDPTGHVLDTPDDDIPLIDGNETYHSEIESYVDGYFEKKVCIGNELIQRFDWNIIGYMSLLQLKTVLEAGNIYSNQTGDD